MILRTSAGNWKNGVMPISPSTQAMKMSLTPRLWSSVSTCSQNFAPSLAEVHSPRTSFWPSSVMPMATYTARFSTRPSMRIFTTSASIDRIERPRLPGTDLVDHRLGHVRDQRGRHLHLIDILQVALDLPCRHAARVQGQDLVVEAMPARLPLGHQLRLEARLPVPRHLDLHRPEVALQPLAARPVAAVAALAAFRRVPFVAQMRRQLRTQRPLHHRLRQL